MRMTQSEAKVPPRDVGASNKHGPPVWPPPILRLRIRGKPRTREPVVDRVPARNKAPASQLQLVLVIRPPSLLWESYVRPPTESQAAQCIETGNNYWDSDRPPDKRVRHSRHRIQSTEPGTGEVWEARREHEGTRSRQYEGTTEREDEKTRIFSVELCEALRVLCG